MIPLKNCLFIDIPKCGTTSVRHALGNPNTGYWHSRVVPAGLEHLPRFAIVRNPYHRALSLYHFERHQCEIGNKPRHPTGPEGFYAEWHLHSLDAFLQRLIWNRENQDKPFPEHYPNFLPCGEFLRPVLPVIVMHLESIHDEWAMHPELPNISIPHKRRQAYSNTLTAKQVDLVNVWAREDFDLYDYTQAHP